MTSFLLVIVVGSLFHLSACGDITVELSCGVDEVEIGGMCYFQTPCTGTWRAMRSLCLDMGGDLVSFHSQGGFDSLVSALNSNGMENYWIGYFFAKVPTGTGWAWSDGSPVDYSGIWSDQKESNRNEPKPDNCKGCGMVLRGTNIRSRHCSPHKTQQLLHGLCSKPPGPPLNPPEPAGPECGNCVISTGTAGCNVPAIEDCVCPSDPFCCDVGWDGICAGEAVDWCGCLAS